MRIVIAMNADYPGGRGTVPFRFADADEFHRCGAWSIHRLLFTRRGWIVFRVENLEREN
jgi:hypothetical protein